MRKFFLLFLLPTQPLFSQTISECKQRFDNYLNFHNSLNKAVKFDTDALYLLNSKGQKEFAVYSHEIPALAKFFENTTLKQQEFLFKQKGIKKFSKKSCDSLLISIENKRAVPPTSEKLPLLGYRIAIDPGHFAANLAEAAAEKKFLYFVKPNGDSVKIFESALTFNTALLLKKMLEEQGAQIFLTRQNSNHTSFNCSFSDWMKLHKQHTLDSLKTNGKLSVEKYSKLKKAKDPVFFWDFFRDYDLANRAVLVNQFNPHLTVIIHYNVDEKNVPWQKTSPKNFTMAFIGGAFTADNLSKPESKLNFVRLLLTNQLESSEKFSAVTVSAFHKNLNIPLATKSCAKYLNESCVATNSEAVFCRNLALCRKINSVLVYGESLYQDNEHEAEQLMKSDVNLYNIQTNARVVSVAKSYYEAILKFLISD